MSQASAPTESSIGDARSVRCALCERALRGCWQPCPDDRHCGLCGERILHLQAGQPTPGIPGLLEVPRHPEVVWLYWHPHDHLTLTLAWSRRLRDQPPKAYLRPVVDVAHCRAQFSTAAGPLNFTFNELPGTVDPPGAMVQLVPQDAHITGPAKLGSECWGKIWIAFDADVISRRARLIPVPANPVQVKCKDASMHGGNGLLQVHQRLKAISIPMSISARVPMWVLRCSPNLKTAGGDDITVHGFEQPVQLLPKKPHLFELLVNSTAWKSGARHPFRFDLTVLSLAAIPIQGAVCLFEGSKLEFGIRNPFYQEIHLGDDYQVGCELIVQDAAGDDDGSIRLINHSVERDPDTGEWLRLLEPLPVPGQAVDMRPGKPGAMVLLVDTRRLERSRFDGKTLDGRVAFLDHRHRWWKFQLHIKLRRWEALDDFVAIDWGTTNSCAAYRSGGDRDGLHPLPLSEQQTETPEIFPSDIYFEDLTDPDRPIFHIGYEAFVRMKDHPECGLHSIKRRFPLDDEVFVMPEKGAHKTFPIKQVVKLLLHRLIAQAETLARKEIRKLGLTFPTKWPPRVRRRLEQVAEELRAELQRERGGEADVIVHPPQIDEANAVALNLLFGGIDRELPPKFCLIAYDFGGGTVDTSVLEVTTADDRLVTRYIGIGGRSDFGGDDVTRAVMMLLRDRLLLAFDQNRAAAGHAVLLQELPLVRDGAPLDTTPRNPAKHHRLGRRNWDTLWRIAEEVKIDLCGSAADNGVRRRLLQHSRDIWCRVGTGGDTAVLAPAGGDDFISLESLLTHLPDGGAALLGARDLNFTLGDACEYPLDDIQYVNHGQRLSVAQRLEDTIKELEWQCAQAGVRPDFIVLAGGGCRLPLVEQMMRSVFQLPTADGLIFDPAFSKRRVAHGLAGYLYLTYHANVGFELARSVDVIHHPIGLLRTALTGRIAVKFERIVPVGAPMNNPARSYAFTFRRGQIRPRLAPLGPREPTGGGSPAPERRLLCLTLQYWRHGGAHERQLGYFDLDNPVPGQASVQPRDAAPLPLVDGEYQGELRLCGPQGIHLHVNVQGERYGPFALDPSESDLELLLQG